MPLDPVARVVIDTLVQVFPDVGVKVLDAAEARRMIAVAPMAAAETIPVLKVENRTIPGAPAGPPIPVRIYWPRAGRDPLPMVVYFHGGGWVLGDLESHDPLCRALANEVGTVVLSVDYRLAPEHRFPAAAEDAYAATVWAAAHAAELGATRSRLAVAGDSAGGNLAAVVPLMARDRGGPPLRGQLLVYPVTDCARNTPSYEENAEGYFLTAAHMRWYWEQYLGAADGSHPYASPLRAPDLSGLPRAYVVTAEYDPLRDEGEAYAHRLRDSGVPVTVRRYDGMFHGFFSLADLLPAAREANVAAFTALREALL
ncbi:MAG: alpha/beta hydrolase family protein [Deltaproteobacteria bacterium]|nr:alpha/beta hydrolase family protein [Deltaproteobacteria bacterium]